HELAHLYQMRTDLCSALICDGRVIRAELHADFIAGILLHRSAISLPEKPASALVRGWREMGDRAVGFNYCNAHGTAEQRLLNLEHGFEIGSRSNGQVFSMVN